MAIEIARNLKEINDELKTTDAQMKAAARDASSLQQSMKLDPSSTKLTAAHYETLASQVDLCSKKIQLLKEKQSEMVAANGPDAKLTPQYERLDTQIAQTEAQQKSLNTQMEKTTKVDFSYVKSGLASIGKTLVGIAGSIVAIGVAYANTASDIADNVKKFGGTAEEWQYQSNAWERLTGDAGAYSSVLSAVISTQANVQKESSKTGNVLSQLGLSFDDLKGKTSAEALQIYMNALSGIGDSATRQSIAVALFGETAGIYIANMCSTGADKISEWNDELTNAGILSNEQVKAGDELADKFSYVKKAVMSLVATYGQSLIPTIESFLRVGEGVMPLAKSIADAMNAIGPAGVVALGVFAAMCAAIPSLVMMLAALNVAADNIPVAIAAYAALAAATGLAIGGVVAANSSGYYSGSSSSATTTSSGAGLSTETASLADKTSVSSSSPSERTLKASQTTNITDSSVNNYYISKDVDADEVIEKITDKKRSLLGGKV